MATWSRTICAAVTRQSPPYLARCALRQGGQREPAVSWLQPRHRRIQRPSRQDCTSTGQGRETSVERKPARFCWTKQGGRVMSRQNRGFLSQIIVQGFACLLRYEIVARPSPGQESALHEVGQVGGDDLRADV